MRIAHVLALALVAAAPAARATCALTPDPAAFRPYAAGLIDWLVLGSNRLAERIDAGDLDGAKQAWIVARIGWERGETFLGQYFPKSDEAIDSWPDAGSGFHAIEPLLFKAGDLADAKPLVAALKADAEALQSRFSGQAFDAQGLISGLAGIAFEIGEGKASGGESPFAGTSLGEMQDNLRGIEALYALSFAAALKRQDPALHERLLGRMMDLQTALAVPSIDALDPGRVMALSEQLAGDVQDAATALCLARPTLGD